MSDAEFVDMKKARDDWNKLYAYARRLEEALRPFAALGHDLKPVAEKLGIPHAGESARSSVSWSDFENAAAVLYGEDDDG